MKIDLEWDFSGEGKWFDFDEDVKLKLRFVPREKLTGIVQRHTRHTRRGEQTDSVKVNSDLYEYAISDWEGIHIADRKAECTRENKIRLLNVHYELFRFVDETITDRDKFFDGGSLEKNSETSSDSN